LILLIASLSLPRQQFLNHVHLYGRTSLWLSFYGNMRMHQLFALPPNIHPGNSSGRPELMAATAIPGFTRAFG
jgi:hypothetical protein